MNISLVQLILELLKEKGAMSDSELLEGLKKSVSEVTSRELNELLMKLEIGGLIHVSSLPRGKKRIELL